MESEKALLQFFFFNGNFKEGKYQSYNKIKVLKSKLNLIFKSFLV